MSFNLLPLQLRINSIRIHPSIPCILSQGVLHFGSKIILAYDFTCLWESSRGGRESTEKKTKSPLWLQTSCPLSSLQKSSAMHYSQTSNKASENTFSLALYCSWSILITLSLAWGLPLDLVLACACSYQILKGVT